MTQLTEIPVPHAYKYHKIYICVGFVFVYLLVEDHCQPEPVPCPAAQRHRRPWGVARGSRSAAG